MTTATDPAYWLAFWIVLAAFGIGCLAVGLGRAAAKPMPRTDEEADRDWQDICAVLGVDPVDVKAAYIDHACAELRAELKEEPTW